MTAKMNTVLQLAQAHICGMWQCLKEAQCPGAAHVNQQAGAAYPLQDLRKVPPKDCLILRAPVVDRRTLLLDTR